MLCHRPSHRPMDPRDLNPHIPKQMRGDSPTHQPLDGAKRSPRSHSKNKCCATDPHTDRRTQEISTLACQEQKSTVRQTPPRKPTDPNDLNPRIPGTNALRPTAPAIARWTRETSTLAFQEQMVCDRLTCRSPDGPTRTQPLHSMNKCCASDRPTDTPPNRLPDEPKRSQPSHSRNKHYATDRPTNPRTQEI